MRLLHFPPMRPAPTGRPAEPSTARRRRRGEFTPHVIGFDDAPFDRTHRGDVVVVGAVFAGSRLDGVLSGRVRRDGANATRVLAGLVRGSRFYPQLHAVLLQGITLAGFNVVDVHGLHAELGVPVLVVSRRRPDMAAIRRALLEHVRGGARKWRLIEAAGPVQPIGALYVQCAGMDLHDAQRLIDALCPHSRVPEPLRVAHIIAGGLTRGESRGRA
ncbi:MAG TPA: DUF99 family protein [Rhodocyclaceae bacterium]|nr:DUF99 family protein [Rhodocyclaceae bacterium]